MLDPNDVVTTTSAVLLVPGGVTAVSVVVTVGSVEDLVRSKRSEESWGDESAVRGGMSAVGPICDVAPPRS